MSDWTATQSAVEKCLPVHLLVNNVGAGANAAFVDVHEADVDRVMAVNFKSMISVTQVS